jgi:hypothetical protein
VYAQFYYARLIVLAVSLVIDVYSAGLWSFAFIRTGLPFCIPLAIASVGAFFVALVAAAFAFDLGGMKHLDPANVVYGFSLFVMQPCVGLLSVLGQTWLVVWLLRAGPKKSHEI